MPRTKKIISDTVIAFDPFVEPVVAVVKTNVHPADALAELRQQKAEIDKRIDALRDQLLADGADLEGDYYKAVLVPSVRETLDRKAITEAYGEKAIQPFIKTTTFSTVKTEKK